MSRALVEAWYAPRLNPLTLALTPLSPLFAVVAALRRALYATRILTTRRLPVPVIVVGNITVGGSGKTPLVAALAHELGARGRHPGIISRGYGRRADGGGALLVARDADPSRVGDEPLLLARAGFPVAVASDRVAAGRALLEANPQCDVIIADDGLQHYALARNVEIAVIDAARGLGNGWRLPAGPLREPASRLASVDAVVELVDAPSDASTGRNGTPIAYRRKDAFRMTLAPEVFHSVQGSGVTRPATAFTGPGIHALAGIGNPERFFAQLRRLGIDAMTHAFPDHHRFSAEDIAFTNASAVLMTEKDAVKCQAFADAHCWYLRVHARIDPALVDRIEEKLRGLQAA